MLKMVSPKVATEVGLTPALVFQHICYWMQTQGVDVIYRTNKELASDLECLSESQIQRAKKKLIDAGLISVSHDAKSKWIRTTYYRLTSKGKALVLSVKNKLYKKDSVENKTHKAENTTNNTSQNRFNDDSSTFKYAVGTSVPENIKQATMESESVLDGVKNQKESTWIPKHLYHQHMTDKVKQESFNKEMIVSESMENSFKEGFGNPNATKGIPEDVLSKLPKHLLKRVKRGGV
jgi:DNA-binding MarR family transcriptional regulator